MSLRAIESRVGYLGAAECQNLEVLEALELNQALVADLRAGQEQLGQSFKLFRFSSATSVTWGLMIVSGSSRRGL